MLGQKQLLDLCWIVSCIEQISGFKTHHGYSSKGAYVSNYVFLVGPGTGRNIPK